MGPLTVNLFTIIFVLTLSHIIYVTYNWKFLISKQKYYEENCPWQAVKMTLQPSFWSMLTTSLGFASLYFTPAEPLRRLGLSGACGTMIALACAYLIFPWFLPCKKPEQVSGSEDQTARQRGLSSLWLRKQPTAFVLILFFSIILSFGIPTLNTDPSLISYFKKGGSIQKGLKFIDQRFGSALLKFVVRDQEGKTFKDGEVLERLWQLQKKLEKLDSVGIMITVPLILAEAEDRVFLAKFLPEDWILEQIQDSKYRDLLRDYVTPNFERSLIYLQMSESVREKPRQETLQIIKKQTTNADFDIELTGGTFILQQQMSQLVIRSLMIGLSLLILFFLFLGFFLSRKLRVTLAMLASLVLIPLILMGIIAHLEMPLDIISAPAVNLAIAMGVDALIHMLLMVKNCSKNARWEWKAWVEARQRLWRPILSASFLVAVGFGIFILSQFPPTARFGLAVAIGSLLAPFTALIILPTLGVKVDSDT
jgi:predicted RND superfamily exporter protein